MSDFEKNINNEEEVDELGDIIYTLTDEETGEEIDLSLLTEEECEIAFPNKRIAEIVCNSDTFEIGVYPVDDNDEVYELAMDDVFSNCEGYFEIYVDADNYRTKEFTFDTEVNVQVQRLLNENVILCGGFNND